MKSIIVNLKCITNMHVGNGDINYNIIDNEVERDPVTGFPTINSSGVKGALREYFKKNHVKEADIANIFGGDGAGRLRILGADMIAMPARASKGSEPYYLISTKKNIEAYIEKKNILLEGKANPEFKDIAGEMAVEGIPLKERCILFGENIYLVSEDEFKQIPLPVMARNHLENGKSTNLWYEEVVPHKSLFCFAVIAENNDEELLKIFIDTIDKKVLQFGGNASIGYGLCKATVEGR